MAKTAIDYYDDGVLLFIRKQTRPTGNSWQAKALQEGWDDSKMAKENPKALNKKYNIDEKKDTRNAVQSHISQLEKLADKAQFCSPAFWRYVNKIEKLEKKYATIL